jgi:8-oxo-dGTP pyrophosphatase MutT (NUDIX family)
MHRNRLKTLLTSYQPVDQTEISSKQEILDFLENHSDCLERTCPPGHFTASAWVLNRTGTHALLMNHRKYGMWTQTGGHCDGDGNLLAVAIKEAREESGISDILPVFTRIFDLAVFDVPERPGEPAHKHYDVRFLLQVQSDCLVVNNEESLEVRWFPSDPAALPTQDPSILRMFEKWQQVARMVS